MYNCKLDFQPYWIMISESDMEEIPFLQYFEICLFI